MPKKSANAISSRYRLKVKERLTILEYVRTHSLLAASRRFGMNRKTIRQWRDRHAAKQLRALPVIRKCPK